MRKIALLAMVGLALMGVVAGTHAESGTGRSRGVVLADTGWGDPCGLTPGQLPPPCRT